MYGEYVDVSDVVAQLDRQEANRNAFDMPNMDNDDDVIDDDGE